MRKDSSTKADDVQLDKAPLDETQLSATASGVEMATRITTAAMVIAVLAIFGKWVDRQLGLNGPFVLSGAFLGLGFFFLQMFRLARRIASSKSARP